MGHAHFFSGRFDEAVHNLLLAIQQDPSNVRALRCLAACYAQMGRLDEAREVVGRMRKISSVFIPDLIEYRNSQQRELYLSGLRLAVAESAPLARCTDHPNLVSHPKRLIPPPAE